MVLAMIVALLSLAVCAEAAVGVKKDGVYYGEATTLDIQGGLSTFDGSTATLFSSGYKDGVTTNVSQESHLTAAALAYGVINRTALDNTVDYKVTLANGTPGQMVTIMLTAVTSGTWTITDDGVDGVTAAALIKTGWDDIKFDAALDSVTLLYVDDTIGWIIIGQNSVTVT